MKVRTLIIAGGSWSKLVECPAAVPALHVQYFDAADQTGRRDLQPGVSVFPIASGQSTASLAKSQRNRDLNKSTRRSGNTPAAAGLSGSRLVGDVAADYTIAQPQFQQFLVSGRSAVFAKCGGNISAMESNCFMGSGGGVGGGAGRKLHRATVADFLAAGVEVRDHAIRLGPMAHTGVRTDDAIVHNAAATIAVDLFSHLFDPLLSPHETRELTLVECPPAGVDESQRDYQVGTLAQALLCSEVREAVTASNVNGRNNLKGVNIVQAAWHQRITPMEIEKAAYAAYAPAIKRLIDTAPSPQIVTPLVIHATPMKRKCASIAEFLTMAGSTAADLRSLVNVAVRGPVKYRPTAQVRTENGKVELAKLDRFLNSFGDGLAEFTAKRRFVASLLPEVEEKLRLWRARKKAANRRLKVEIGRLVLVLVWCYAKGGFFSRLVSGAQLSLKKGSRLRKRLEAVRAAANDCDRAAAIVRLLRRARQRLSDERNRIQKLLTQIAQALDPFEPFRPDRHPPVEMAGLAEAWEVLTHLEPGLPIANGRALVQLARRVTPHGLKSILGARDFDVASLAKALTTAEPTEGPHWCGDAATRHYHTTFHVLPPIPQALRTQLESQLFGRGIVVKFADSCAAGVTAVRLKLSTPLDTSERGLDEIFTPQLRAAFKETIRRANRRDFYPQGDEAWQWLADQLRIRLRSNRIGSAPVSDTGDKGAPTSP